MRIDKFLAHNGFGSRKDARKLIKDKLVFINDLVVDRLDQKLDVDKDVVRVMDEVINYVENVYIMLNKPSGYICSHEAELYPSVLELIDTTRNDLIIVGRLDVDTEGLLIITSDGKFSHKIAHGKNNIYKKYYVELQEDFDTSYIDEIEKGITLDDGDVKPAIVEMIDERSLYLSIAEGRYHQVKRMMHYCNNEVLYLRRIMIADLEMDESLEAGEYRYLDDNDFNLLHV